MSGTTILERGSLRHGIYVTLLFAMSRRTRNTYSSQTGGLQLRRTTEWYSNRDSLVFLVHKLEYVQWMTHEIMPFIFVDWSTNTSSGQGTNDWIQPSLHGKDNKKPQRWPSVVFCHSQTPTEPIYTSPTCFLLSLSPVFINVDKCYVLWKRRFGAKFFYIWTICSLTWTGKIIVVYKCTYVVSLTQCIISNKAI